MDGDFRLASWLVQPSLNTVSRNGTTVQLEPKVMSVLVRLAEHPGEPLSKEALLKTVWPDTFVGEGVLTRSVFELRRVFEDDAKEPRVIQTIAKRGYRLVAPVVPMNANRTPAASKPQTAGYRSKLRYAGAGLSGAAMLVGIFFLNNVIGLRTRLLGDNTPPIHSLAVLPLQNLSGDPGLEYFSDGMTEELITELSRISGLKVISRTSVMRYKKSDKSLPEIARELNVDAIVEGSVLRSGDRVRITAQLIHARTDANVWAETYDRTLQDTLAVQEVVASAIAGKMKASMIPSGSNESRTRRPINLKAHEAYLRGIDESHFHAEMSNHQGMEAATEEHRRRAVAYYEEAIREDSKYAPAYVALAGESPTPERAETYARNAMEADDSLPDAHLIMGAIRLVRDRNWQDSEKEILRALELNPNSAAAHNEHGFFLDAVGKLDEGLKEFQRAQELDPAGDHLGATSYVRREFDQVIESGRMDLANCPARFSSDCAIVHKLLMVAYAREGKRKESVEEFRAALVSMGYEALADDLRRGYAEGGYEVALRAWLKGVKKQPEFPFKWVETYVYTELHDYDQAFAQLPKLPPDWLNTAYSDAAEGFYNDVRIAPTLVTLRIEPMWDPLHSDPRFDELVRKLGFPQ